MTTKQCDGKNCYSKNESKHAKGWVGMKRGKRMRLYVCPKCGYYHLSSVYKDGKIH